MALLNTTSTVRLCPICHMGPASGYAGTPPCSAHFAGSPEAHDEHFASLKRQGCLYLNSPPQPLPETPNSVEGVNNKE